MKTSLMTQTLAFFMALSQPAEKLLNSSFSLSPSGPKTEEANDFIPCGCVDGEKTFRYSIDQVTDTGVCLEPGDSYKVAREKHGAMTYGSFIHLGHGNFDTFTGCGDCSQYNDYRIGADDRNGLLMLVQAKPDNVKSVDNVVTNVSRLTSEDVIQSDAAKRYKDNHKTIAVEQKAKLLLWANDMELGNNKGSGEITLDFKCAKKAPRN